MTLEPLRLESIPIHNLSGIYTGDVDVLVIEIVFGVEKRLPIDTHHPTSIFQRVNAKFHPPGKVLVQFIQTQIHGHPGIVLVFLILQACGCGSFLPFGLLHHSGHTPVPKSHSSNSP